MELRAIKAVTVTYEDGSTETFEGDVGAVSDYSTYIKNSDGKQHQTLKIVTTTLTTERSDWLRGPVPVGA
jgi:hypothetical protein